MKLTRTEAKALANKARTVLLKVQSEQIENFVPDQKLKDEIREFVSRYLETMHKWYKLQDELREKFGFCIYSHESEDCICEKLMKIKATKASIKVPNLETLIDDIIVESLGVGEVSELLDRVVVRYSK